MTRRNAWLRHWLVILAMPLSACGPGLTAISPQAAPVGALVTITGSGLGSSQGSSEVFFDGVSAGAAASWASSSITIAVPAGATTGPVTVKVGPATSIAKPFIVSAPRAEGLRIGTRIPSGAVWPLVLSSGDSKPRGIQAGDDLGSHASSSQRALATADFNADGDPDLVRGAGDAVVWYLGDGSGRLSPGGVIQLELPAGAIGGIVAADFDHDSHVDLVASAFTRIAFLRGDGAGGFAPPQYSPATDRVSKLVVDDYDQDSNLDVVSTALTDLHVFFGDGHGSFAAPTNVPVGTATRGLATGDLNRDSYPDLVVSNASLNAGQPGSLYVLLNDTAGAFLLQPLVGSDSAPSGLAMSDFDQDGDLDVALVHDEYFAATNKLVVYENDGAGTVARAFEIGLNDTMTALNGADLNGDGLVDLVAGGLARTYTFLSFGDGTFLPLDESYRDNVLGLVVADFDRDARQDVFTNGSYGDTLILGDGSGGLSSASFLQLTSDYGAFGGVDAGDFNEDGKVDLVADVTAFDPESNVAVLLNDGTGQFSTSWNPVEIGGGAVAADVNGDGHQDVVRIANGPSLYLQVLIGDGQGNLSGPVGTSLNSLSGGSGAAGDLDGDGDDDFVMSVDAVVQIWFSNGNGTFGSPVILENVQIDYTAIAVARVNGDTANDIVFKTESFFDDDGDIRVYLGDGSGGFTLSDLIPSDGGQLAVGDVNNDGIADLLDTDDPNQSPTAYRTWLGNGDGTFVGPVTSPYIGVPSGIGDFNEDGWPDAAGNSNGGLRLALGDGTGAFAPTVDRYASAQDPTLTADVNADGHLDVVEWTYWGHLAFYLGDGQGNFVDYD